MIFDIAIVIILFNFQPTFHKICFFHITLYLTFSLIFCRESLNGLLSQLDEKYTANDIQIIVCINLTKKNPKNSKTHLTSRQPKTEQFYIKTQLQLLLQNKTFCILFTIMEKLLYSHPFNALHYPKLKINFRNVSWERQKLC